MKLNKNINSDLHIINKNYHPKNHFFYDHLLFYQFLFNNVSKFNNLFLFFKIYCLKILLYSYRNNGSDYKVIHKLVQTNSFIQTLRTLLRQFQKQKSSEYHLETF